MGTDTETTFMHVNAIPAERLRQFRATGRDDNGEAIVGRFDAEGGAPLRCCLRDSRPGEQIALIGYRPMRHGGAYAEVGPIFIHAGDCAGYPTAQRYPEEFRGRPQVFRAYRADGTISGGVLVQPGGQEAAIRDLWTDPKVALIHSRNVVYGCFMFEIVRPPAEPNP